MGTGPLGFFANPQLSTGLICLYQLPFESGWPCFSPQHDELSRTYVGLKGQHFPLSLTVEVSDYLITIFVTLILL